MYLLLWTRQFVAIYEEIKNTSVLDPAYLDLDFESRLLKSVEN